MTDLKEIHRWLLGDSTGMSSKYLASIFLGVVDEDTEVAWPHDPSDFARCYKFINLLSATDAIAVMRKASALELKWATIFGNWGALVDLYEEEKDQKSAPRLYKLMKDIGL